MIVMLLFGSSVFSQPVIRGGEDYVADNMLV